MVEGWGPVSIVEGRGLKEEEAVVLTGAESCCLKHCSVESWEEAVVLKAVVLKEEVCGSCKSWCSQVES